MGVIMGKCCDNAALEREEKLDIKIPISLYSIPAAGLEGLIFALKYGALELMTSADCHLSPRVLPMTHSPSIQGRTGQPGGWVGTWTGRLTVS